MSLVALMAAYPVDRSRDRCAGRDVGGTIVLSGRIPGNCQTVVHMVD
jgi:hypothetical protein